MASQNKQMQRLLKKHGFRLDRKGRHPIYVNDQTGQRFLLPSGSGLGQTMEREIWKLIRTGRPKYRHGQIVEPKNQPPTI